CDHPGEWNISQSGAGEFGEQPQPVSIATGSDVCDGNPAGTYPGCPNLTRAGDPAVHSLDWYAGSHRPPLGELRRSASGQFTDWLEVRPRDGRKHRPLDDNSTILWGYLEGGIPPERQ